MKKIIHNLRKQPEHIKRSVLHIATMVCGVVLISLWVYSLGVHYGSPDTQVKMEQNLKPFSVLKDNLQIPESW